MSNVTLPSETPDFRAFLQAELARRTRINPRYSLRAFAIFLDVQSGFLSKLLLGQRRITPQTVRKFGARLGLHPAEIERFETQQARSELAPAVDAYKQMAYDHFQLLSDWYHFAILELSAIEGFKPEPRWISKALRVPVPEINEAIARLKRLEFIQEEEDGAWIILGGRGTTTIGTELTSAALRKMQKQVLELAMQALEETPVDKRDQTTMTTAIDSSRLPRAKEMIRDFRRELTTYLEGGDKRDAVYHLSVSLYPVSRRTEDA